MFGQNPIRKTDHGDGSRLWVQEVFHTIQGEGPFSGEPAVFVRLAGCNLQCWFCDTDFESSIWQPQLESLMNHIRNNTISGDLVVLTGGEPMRQNIVPLCEALLDAGYRVQVETAGTVVPPGFLNLVAKTPGRLFIVCSPKTPSINADLLPWVHAWKYVVRHGECSIYDGLPLYSTQRKGKQQKLQRPPHGVPVFVQPMDQQDVQQNALNVQQVRDSALTHGHRASIQLHKLLEVE